LSSKIARYVLIGSEVLMKSPDRLATARALRRRNAALRWARAVGLGAVLVLAAIPCSALDFSIPQPAKVPGGEVRFNTIVASPADKLPEPDQVVSTPHYKVYADLDGITYRPHGFFSYTIYVIPKPGVEGNPTRFTVNGEPVGTFPVQKAVVEFVISEGGNEEKNWISLPVSGTDATGYLVTPSWTEPEDVELPGETEIPLLLQNALPEWPVSVVGVQQPSRKKVWSKVRLSFMDSEENEFKEFDILPGRPVNDRVVLRLKPNSAQALTQLFFSRAGGSVHEKVVATLDYRAPWGVPGSLAIEIPVRFVPWPPLLFLAVAVGTLLGSVIPILTGQRRRSRWPRAFTASLLIAIVMELLAIVLQSHDSQFRLLGVELDPFQLLPAMLIGIFMGLLGFRSLDILKKILDGKTRATV
jgi:hypothetical protein